MSPISRRAAFSVVPALWTAGCASSPAQSQRVAAMDFADLAEQVLPAVVNIAVTSEQSQVPQEFRGTPLERPFRERGRGRQVQGAGSGFIIDPAGYVVTNNHVVGNSNRVVVALQDGTELPARVVGTDELTDLALLRVVARGGSTLRAVPWGSSGGVRVGQWVLAAGNPFGLGGTVTSGIISARGREIGAGPFDDFLQTDAAINPGNSGGPLFNIAGEVVGINTAIYSPSGASAGIGFATPSDLARTVIDQLRRDGRVERGWLGVAVQDAGGPAAEGGAPVPATARNRRGVLVQGVERSGID